MHTVDAVTTGSRFFRTFFLFLILSVTVCSSKYWFRENNLEPYTLEEYLTGAIQQNGWSGNWISGLYTPNLNFIIIYYVFPIYTEDSFIFRDTSGTGDILIYNARNYSTNIYFDGSILASIKYFVIFTKFIKSESSTLK